MSEPRIMPQPGPTILFLISSEGYYGAESMLVTLGRTLQQLECRCVVGVFRDSRFPHTEVGDQALSNGLAVEIVPCSGRLDWRTIAQVRKLLLKHQVDVLHSHGYKADAYAYAAALVDGVTLVATSHNWPSKLMRMRAYAGLDRLILRRFDKVITASDGVARTLLRSGVAREKVHIVFNGIDVERFHAPRTALRSAPAREGGAVVGFVGRLVPEKGGAQLIRAAEWVLKVYPHTSFVFVGEGPSRTEWDTFAEKSGISQRVTFAGRREDMPETYASLDMLVLPSSVESMPMCILEAMAAGKPVIATAVGAVPRLVIPGQTGLLLDSADAIELAAAIIHLLSNPELATRLGEAGRAHATRHFSARAMATHYLAHYQEVLARRATPTREREAIRYG
jgi:glycosyltransferase involved in cell wall biosynthesis